MQTSPAINHHSQHHCFTIIDILCSPMFHVYFTFRSFPVEELLFIGFICKFEEFPSGHSHPEIGWEFVKFVQSGLESTK